MGPNATVFAGDPTALVRVLERRRPLTTRYFDVVLF
jgi:hypothetical protein